MVGRVTRNTILKGERFKGKRKSKRINSTGRHKSQKADPSELRTREVKHLAFFEPAYYDRVVAKVNLRNAKYQRTKDPEADPRRRVPKKRTRFPGQSVFCGICGRLFVFGGHGQKDHLMCDGARQHKCWNGASFDGPFASAKIVTAVLDELKALPDFDSAFLELINEEASSLDAARGVRQNELNARIRNCDREIGNLMRFIRSGDDSQTVRDELRRLESEKILLAYDRDEAGREPAHALEIPGTEMIRQIAMESMTGMATDSFEFARVMQDLTDNIHVLPYMLCKGGPVVLRGTFSMLLANVLPDQRLRDVLCEPLRVTRTVDFFDSPQPVAFREQVLAQRASGESERQAATALGLTITAAQAAAKLDRHMKALGLVDPYVRVTQPSSDCPKFRRYLHPRYRFEPLAGYPLE